MARFCRKYGLFVTGAFCALVGALSPCHWIMAVGVGALLVCAFIASMPEEQSR